MIKEAILQIIEMATGKIIKDDFGRQVWDKTGDVMPDPVWPTLEVYSLSAFAGYINAVHPTQTLMGKDDFIHVISPSRVVYRCGPDAQKLVYRSYSIAMCGRKVFPFNNFVDLETFIVRLRTMFVETDAVKKIIEIVGNLSDDLSIKTKDDGFGQEVTIKAGITKAANVTLPNPVLLQPYRTFEEVEQPWSEFILRINKGYGIECALFDVGGNSWESRACENIVAWLKDNIENKDIPIIG